MITGGAYSEKYRLAETNRMDAYKDVPPEHMQALAARDRVKRLSAETNRRRKALEQKKKLEAQREVRRRQEVLSERSRKQQEATLKYQRLNRTGSGRKQGERHHDLLYSGPKLQDGVSMVKGYKVERHNSGHSLTPQKTPSLEEVMRMVGTQNNVDALRYTQTQYNSQNSDWTAADGNCHENNPSFDHQQTLARNANNIPASSESRNTPSYHGYVTEATSIYQTHVDNNPSQASNQQQTQTRTDTNSVKSIEEDLIAQQRAFIEQQRKSLLEFNKVLMHETNGDIEGVLERSNSVSSVDSLEEESNSNKQNKNVNINHARNNYNSPCTALYRSASDGNINDNFVSSKPSVYNWNVSKAQDDPSDGALATHEYSDLLQGSSVSTSKAVTFSPSSFTGGSSVGSKFQQTVPYEPTPNKQIQKQREITNISQNMQPSTNKTQLAQNGLMNAHGNLHKNNDLQSSFRAWEEENSHSAPGFGNHSSSHTTTQGHHNYGNVVHSPNKQQFSAKTSATPVSVTPPVSRKYTSEESLPSNVQKNSQNLNVQKQNKTPIKYVLKKAQPLFVKPEESDHAKLIQEKSDVASPPDEVRSILKKFSAYTSEGSSLVKENGKLRLGKNMVKDSLEITRTNQNVRAASKKSVRWGDLNYSNEDDENCGSLKMVDAEAKQRLRLEEKAKPLPSTNARIVQQKLTASQRLQEEIQVPKGPVLVPRSSYKQRLHQKPASQVQSRSEFKSNVRTYSTPVGKPPSGKSTENAKTENIDQNNLQRKNVLNKTPTDEEINLLWNKVRTCLDSRESTPDPQNYTHPISSAQNPDNAPKITANLKVAPPSRTNSSTVRKYHTVPRWRTNSDMGSSFLRRSALLQQRQHRALSSRLQNSRAGIGQNQPMPASSQQGPNRSSTVNQQAQNIDVSDSLLAFQQLEHLTQQNLSDAEIAAALENPPHMNQMHYPSQNYPTQMNHYGTNKVPTALSIEEQRILESLDRLNEKLRITSEAATGSTNKYAVMHPRPPAYGTGFRGHRPLSSKTSPANTTTGLNVHGRSGSHLRSFSADRTNNRITPYR